MHQNVKQMSLFCKCPIVEKEIRISAVDLVFLRF